MTLPNEFDITTDERSQPIIDADVSQVYIDIHKERIRAHAKHGGHGGRDSMEVCDFDLFWRWLSVVGEEYGEVCRVVCEWRHGNVKQSELPATLREELVQLAAMTTAWIAAIDRAE